MVIWILINYWLFLRVSQPLTVTSSHSFYIHRIYIRLEISRTELKESSDSDNRITETLIMIVESIIESISTNSSPTVLQDYFCSDKEAPERNSSKVRSNLKILRIGFNSKIKRSIKSTQRSVLWFPNQVDIGISININDEWLQYISCESRLS